MLYVDELKKRESMDDTNIHASVISGKVRISSFSVTLTAEDIAAGGATELTIAYLPAGRGRALPVLSRINSTVELTIGMGSYVDAVPSVGTVAENKTILATNIVSGSTSSFDGAVEGVPYHSVNDIPVIAYGTFAAGTVVKGIVVYNVT